jgi:hypothetical protein
MDSPHVFIFLLKITACVSMGVALLFAFQTIDRFARYIAKQEITEEDFY